MPEVDLQSGMCFQREGSAGARVLLAMLAVRVTSPSLPNDADGIFLGTEVVRDRTTGGGLASSATGADCRMTLGADGVIVGT